MCLSFEFNSVPLRNGVTFAELRTRVIEQVHSGGGVGGGGVGCSRRELAEVEGTQCADNQMYCWMRCMDYTPQASPTAGSAPSSSNLG